MHKDPPSPKQSNTQTSVSLPRLAIKTVCLFIAINLVYAPINPLPALGHLSAYNILFPGRLRLPYGENPSQSYNLSLFSLEAMFASHAVATPKNPSEYRVVLIGDSSTWGYLLKPDQTLSAKLNAAKLTRPDGRQVHVYNLGYPTLSLAKDLMILKRSLRYQPDLIIWLVSLESFPRDKQLSSPIVQHNPTEMQALIQTYAINLDPNDPGFVRQSFWQNTLLGQRRALADLLRLQLYGVMWAATGIDQYYPASYEPPQVDLPADQTFHGLVPPILKPEDLSLDILQAGFQAAGETPVLLVNEPIFLSSGENSNIRYNFFYPRWAYDQYRQMLAAQSLAHGWDYLDLWQLLPAQEFTNSAIHVTPAGEAEISRKIATAISNIDR
jgi:lysophospholipase L1-like esterase